MNQAASVLNCKKGKVFKREEMEKKEIISKKYIVLGKNVLFRGTKRVLSADYLRVLSRVLHIDWLKSPI